MLGGDSCSHLLGEIGSEVTGYSGEERGAGGVRGDIPPRSVRGLTEMPRPPGLARGR